MDQNTIKEGKTEAIISYIFVIGLIIAYFMNMNKKNEFANFHIGQSFRVWLLSIALSIALRVMDVGFLSILGWAPMVLAILGLMNAINEKAEPLPIIGNIGK